MKLKGRPLMMGFLILVFIAFFSVFNVHAAEEITITGQIITHDWDEEDKAKAVIIITDENDAYYVFENNNGKKLLKLVGKIVTATGAISEDIEGKLFIDIGQKWAGRS
jgi:hypothetical protein